MVRHWNSLPRDMMESLHFWNLVAVWKQDACLHSLPNGPWIGKKNNIWLILKFEMTFVGILGTDHWASWNQRLWFWRWKIFSGFYCRVEIHLGSYHSTAASSVAEDGHNTTDIKNYVINVHQHKQLTEEEDWRKVPIVQYLSKNTCIPSTHYLLCKRTIAWTCSLT